MSLALEPGSVYDSLTDSGQRAMRALGVFEGRGTVDGLNAVLGGPGRAQTTAAASELAAKSIVVLQDSTEPDWFEFDQRIRVFARERLEASGELDQAEERYVDYYVELAQQQAERLHGAGQLASYRLLEWEHDNLKATLRRLVDHAQWEPAIYTASALSEFWWRRGYRVEGRTWLQELVGHAEGVDEGAVMRTLVFAGRAATFAKNADLASQEIRRGLAIARRRGDKPFTAVALTYLGWLEVMQGDTSGMELLTEANHIWKGIGQGAPAWRVAETHAHVGSAQLALGRCERAVVSLRTAAAGADKAQDQQLAAGTLAVLAAAQLCLNDVPAAVDSVKAAVTRARTLSCRYLLTTCIDVVILLSANEIDPERTAQLVGARDAMSSDAGSMTYMESLVPSLTLEARRRIALEHYRASYDAGHAMSPDAAGDLLERTLAAFLEQGVSARPAVTMREAAMLRLMADGLSDGEIEARLGMSARTLRRVNATLFAKLGANNRSQAIALAAARGLLDEAERPFVPTRES